MAKVAKSWETSFPIYDPATKKTVNLGVIAALPDRKPHPPPAAPTSAKVVNNVSKPAPKSVEVRSEPREIDALVGGRLRVRRTILGLSQTELAVQVGVTFQQLQKYERGFNRVSASRLFQFARILGVPVSYFFEPVDGAASAADDEVMCRRETLELVRHYNAIEDADKRAAIATLIHNLAEFDGFP